MFQDIGELIALFWRTLQSLPLAWRQRRKVAEQLFEIGNASLLMACILSLFIGGVVTLQVGPIMAERGLGNYIGRMVGIAMSKELGPVMMAILIAGRIGSAMAAEIGSMQVYQEIDALRTMNIPPIQYLVLPRLVAIAIALPILVLFSILVGWTGGALVAVFNQDIGISYATYFGDLKGYVDVADLTNGLFKGLTFAIVIGMVSCHQGFQTIGGPRGIGRSVTKAVVNSIVLILLLDYVITRSLMLVD
jgi:phospholipid/cholesterol/gamma-HCH transport system permease protein